MDFQHGQYSLHQTRLNDRVLVWLGYYEVAQRTKECMLQTHIVLDAIVFGQHLEQLVHGLLLHKVDAVAVGACEIAQCQYAGGQQIDIRGVQPIHHVLEQRRRVQIVHRFI